MQDVLSFKDISGDIDKENISIEKVIQAYGAMCNRYSCEICPLGKYRNGFNLCCKDLQVQHPEKAVEIIKDFIKRNDVYEEIQNAIKLCNDNGLIGVSKELQKLAKAYQINKSL